VLLTILPWEKPKELASKLRSNIILMNIIKKTTTYKQQKKQQHQKPCSKRIYPKNRVQTKKNNRKAT